MKRALSPGPTSSSTAAGPRSKCRHPLTWESTLQDVKLKVSLPSLHPGDNCYKHHRLLESIRVFVMVARNGLRLTGAAMKNQNPKLCKSSPAASSASARGLWSVT